MEIKALRRRPLRSATNASRAEQFAIWAMRLWWGAFPDLDRAWPDLVSGFRSCGVAAAIESCHRFCSIALAAARCGDDACCLHCPGISPTEEKLLEALAFAGRGDVDFAEASLRRVMPASAARLAAPHAVQFARALPRSGMHWPAETTSRLLH